MGGLKFCWAPSEEEAVKIAHRTWPNSALPDELAQVLPQPAHFEQASSVVTEDMVRQQTPCGPDPEPYLRSVRTYVDAGYDELYVQNIGPYQQEFFRFFEREVRPQVA